MLADIFALVLGYLLLSASIVVFLLPWIVNLLLA
jgi:hypothetical protein